MFHFCMLDTQLMKLCSNSYHHCLNIQYMENRQWLHPRKFSTTYILLCNFEYFMFSICGIMCVIPWYFSCNIMCTQTMSYTLKWQHCRDFGHSWRLQHRGWNFDFWVELNNLMITIPCQLIEFNYYYNWLLFRGHMINEATCKSVT